MRFAVGSLVRARGREWVVLPESDEHMLVLRPLGGTEDEVTGIYAPLEQVEAAHFDLPDPTQPGDYRSCRLLIALAACCAMPCGSASVQVRVHSARLRASRLSRAPTSSCPCSWP